ncbi:MAG: AarF/ABC1/UbiB kinase family protein [Myxococcota bacterium]|jgi:predicted unusual protein kinase regulating ubiquinone biosynthesis (AarF/ABC1/UbiB family)|nr:AarF/ABC1/UbiB kinase family protein [Myxococcota bacterium]
MAEDDDKLGSVGKGGRFFRLAGMTAAVASRYASTRLRTAFSSKEDKEKLREDSHREMGQRIAKTLGELKGAAMKVGQMASLNADLLPRELAQALRVLQREAPPLPFSVIENMIEKEFGTSPFVLFRSFEREPFASASIGQVHRAVVDDGRQVVVKVQYPGVDSSVDSDLSHLKLALRASGLLRINRKALDAVFGELRDRLHEELDYCNEADNVRTFRDFHKRHDFVHVPEVVGERSSKRVLTLTYVPGDNINELDELDYPQEIRDQLGANLYRLFFEQVFVLNALHADPNPANFAFRRDGSVVLYDFGCVKRLSPELVALLAKILRQGVLEEYEALDQSLFDLGARVPGTAPIDAAFYAAFRDPIAKPFLPRARFDYGSAHISEDIVKLWPMALRKLTSFQPAVDIMFVDRVAAGHYGNLKTIAPRGDFLTLIEPYLGLSGDEGQRLAALRDAADADP